MIAKTIAKPSTRRGIGGRGRKSSANWSAMLHSVLKGANFINRIVRSLAQKLVDGTLRLGFRFFSFLLYLFQPMMLAGLRCAGAGGGGPGI